MNKKFFKNAAFLILSLSCFLLSAEQKNSASHESKSVATNSETVNQAEQKSPDSDVTKAVSAHSEAAAQEEQKEQLTLHSPETHTKPEQSSPSSMEIETINKTQGKKELSSVLTKEHSKLDNSYNQRFLELGLEYPINFGVHIRYLLGDSFYTRFGISFMPRLFLDSFTKLSPYFGYLNEEEAGLISNTFENSIYLDFRLAWAPYLQKSVMGGGPYLELGLSGAFYGNGELEGSHLSRVIKDSAFKELKTYSVKTNAYNATVHAGYQIPFEKVKLNIELGLIKILHADVLSVKKVNAPELLSTEQKQKFTSFLESWEKGWIFPTVSGWISFAF